MQIRSIVSKQVGPSEQVLFVQEWMFFFDYVNVFVFLPSYVEFLLQLCNTLVFLTVLFFILFFLKGKAQGCISGLCSFANAVSPFAFSPLTGTHLCKVTFFGPSI